MSDIYISGAAHKTLTSLVKKWSGDKQMVLHLGETPHPDLSPFAVTKIDEHEMWVDPDYMILNPNRVLNVVTPFRLRQEGVLTGALLHECAHVRYSHWAHHTKHADGKPVAAATRGLAMVMEEARIEAYMAMDAAKNGASGLEWTMRASAARLLADTVVSHDPAKQVMDVIQSWALRAGREIALTHTTRYHYPPWVDRFTDILRTVLSDHFDAVYADAAMPSSVPMTNTMKALTNALLSGMHDGTFMLDKAREVLELLFPETGADGAPVLAAPCSHGEEDEEDGEGSGGGQDGDESGDKGSGGASGQSDSDEARDGDAMAEALAKILAGIEQEADDATAQVAADEAAAPPPPQSAQPDESGQKNSQFGGMGAIKSRNDGWRNPSPTERDTQRQAEEFLRNLVAPTETGIQSLSDSPSSAIDGAALSAWKAGGQHHDPRFFVRTRRDVKPAPPVRVAILVDISSSMGILQEPSALLSWALASAAVDLKNFAGRGQQVESCLIHWGDSAHVVQRNGEALPGIRTVRCDEGTSAMAQALDLVEAEMPGFFEPNAEGCDSNRLLVQFTDWELNRDVAQAAVDKSVRGVANGVNMLTVSPKHKGSWFCAYPEEQAYTSRGLTPRGRQAHVVYNRNPEAVWSSALDMLNGKTPPPFNGF